MEEGKKIKIARKTEHVSEEDKRAQEILDEIQPLVDKVEKSCHGDREWEFLKRQKGKPITLMFTTDKEIEGKLHDIGNFGIFIIHDEKKKYFYKHTIIGYFAS